MSHLATLLNLTSLANLPRTGWLLAGVQNPESVACHSHGVAVVVLALGPEIEDLDTDRAVSLAVAHDLPEAWLTDLPKRTKELFEKGEVDRAEARAAGAALAGLPTAGERFAEYKARATREARFVGACDKLHLGLMALAYRAAGNRNLEEFMAGVAALDMTEFAPCAALQAELVERWRADA